MAEELKACQFCGGEPNLTHSDYVHDDLRPMPVVECKSCSAWVRAEDWNRRAQMPSQGGEAVEVVGYHNQISKDWSYVGRVGWEPLMTVAQHQRILAASVGSAEPAGWYTEDHLTDKSATTYDREVAERWRAKGWPVAPLYTHPADQVSDDHTMVKVSRELLVKLLDEGRRAETWAAQDELRALLAKSEGVKK